MHYLVIDLEATCDEGHRIPREQTEIIEIGAVMCDGETLEPIGEHQTFVRPVRHPILTPFCTKLTSIVQADVEGAPPFAEAIAAMGTWLAEWQGQFLFCSWGRYDKHQLDREAHHAGLRLPLGKKHLNLKEEFARHVRDAGKLGMGQALRRVGLTPIGTAHRGIDDARNIARLLPWCLGRVAEGPPGT